jgi:hypothetical protein
MAAQAMSNYLNPGDPAGVVRFKVPSPRDSMWDDMPIDPFTEILASTKFYTFRDDNDLTNVWSQLKDGEGATVFALLNRKGGGITFDSGSTGLASYNYAETDNYTFAFESGKQTWIEFSISVEEQVGPPVGNDISTIQVGFADGVSASPLGAVANNLFALDVWNGDVWNTLVYDTWSEGALVQNNGAFTGTDGNAITGDNSPMLVSDGDFHTIGIHFEPSSVSYGNFDILVFLDGDFTAVARNVAMPAEAMGIFVGTYSHNDRVQVEHVYVIQED